MFEIKNLKTGTVEYMYELPLDSQIRRIALGLEESDDIKITFTRGFTPCVGNWQIGFVQR